MPPIWATVPMAKSAKTSGEDRTREEATKEPMRSNELADFDRRLAHAKSRYVEAPDDGKARGSAMGTAFRISTELVAGLLVGGLIGWQLDKWLGTSPVLLLVFFLLGAAAGIMNVIRTAWKMQSGASDSGEPKDPGSGSANR